MQETPPENPSLNDANQRALAVMQRALASQALRGQLGDQNTKWFKTGRGARRAARRGYGMHNPLRSRCQRSAERRGVRKVWLGLS